MSKKKNNVNKRRQAFLLTFFDSEPKHEFKEINGFILEKRWDGNSRNWEVGIYSKESWKKVQEYLHRNQQQIIK